MTAAKSSSRENLRQLIFRKMFLEAQYANSERRGNHPISRRLFHFTLALGAIHVIPRLRCGQPTALPISHLIHGTWGSEL